MLLAVDIGNSLAKFGVFDGERLVLHFAVPTANSCTPESWLNEIKPKLTSKISAAIVSSVVPDIREPFSDLCRQFLDVNAIFVDNSFDLGLSAQYEPPTAVGIDRLIAASAAAAKYGVPCIVCDFGTATTIDAVSQKKEYLGGTISPGMRTMAESLRIKTAKLPLVDIAKPDRIIGNTTIGSIQSGIFYGYIGLVEGIISRIKGELGENAKVIATGGFAALIAENTSSIKIVDEFLMLDGLRMAHARII